jgi:hypothetical protein
MIDCERTNEHALFSHTATASTVIATVNFERWQHHCGNPSGF